MDYYTHDRIGVIDSGIGGLTVVKQIQIKFPEADVVFIGDSANCPYGNKSKLQLIELGSNLINTCKDFGCNKVILGCNTLSTLIDLFKDNDIPVIDIISPVIEYITANDVRDIGVLGTEATIASGKYHLPGRVNIELGNKQLAKYIDDYDVNSAVPLLNSEIELCRKNNCSTILLGCTHYPIILDEIDHKDLTIIDPASLLADKLQVNSINGSIKVFTTGNLDIYKKVCEYLHIENVEYNKLSEKEKNGFR